MPFANLLTQVGQDLLAHPQYPTAEAYLRECLAVLRAKQPAAWGTFAAESLLGGALLGQAKYADAEPLLLAGYEGVKAAGGQLPPTAQPDLREAAERLVRLYEAWDRPAEAARWRAERAKYDPPPDPPAPGKR